MEKKQTAVEWLFSQLPEHLRTSRDGFDMLNQAKAMEKEQIMEAYYSDRFPCAAEDSERYYTETYENQ